MGEQEKFNKGDNIHEEEEKLVKTVAYKIRHISNSIM